MRTILFALLLHLSFAWASDSLSVGMELSYPPFEMVCIDGSPCGISVDIAQAFGEYLKKQTLIQNISFTGLIPSLRNGIVDVIISSLTVTEERNRAIAFSDPYATSGLCLLISLKSTVEEIQDVNMPGIVIVVKSGTTGELYAKKHLHLATVRVLDKEAMCVLEVIQGKADAFIYDQLSVYSNWQKNLKTTKANLIPFEKAFWAFGIKKNNPELLAQANLFIQKFREEGGFDKLADKYLPEQKKAFKELGVPFVF